MIPRNDWIHKMVYFFHRKVTGSRNEQIKRFNQKSLFPFPSFSNNFPLEKLFENHIAIKLCVVYVEENKKVFNSFRRIL